MYVSFPAPSHVCVPACEDLKDVIGGAVSGAELREVSPEEGEAGRQTDRQAVTSGAQPDKHRIPLSLYCSV